MVSDLELVGPCFSFFHPLHFSAFFSNPPKKVILIGERRLTHLSWEVSSEQKPLVTFWYAIHSIILPLYVCVCVRMCACPSIVWCQVVSRRTQTHINTRMRAYVCVCASLCVCQVVSRHTHARTHAHTRTHSCILI